MERLYQMFFRISFFLLINSTFLFCKSSSNITKFGFGADFQTNWTNGKNGCNTNRQKYVDSIVNSKSLIGLSKKHIEKLFGKSELKSDINLVYIIEGRCDIDGNLNKDADYCALVFAFDEKSKLNMIALECS